MKDVINDFNTTTQTEDFHEWQKKKEKEDAERLHVDLNTREGLIASIMDLFDQLGFCVQANAQRDENGLIVYDENGEPLLLEGETEPKLLARAELVEALEGKGGNK